MSPADRDNLTAHARQICAAIEGIAKARSKALDNRSLHQISSWRLLDVSHDLLCMWVRLVEAEIRFDIAADEAAQAGEIRGETAAQDMHRMATATPEDRMMQADAERRHPLLPPHVAPYAEQDG